MVRGHYDPLGRRFDRRGMLRLMGGTTALALGSGGAGRWAPTAAAQEATPEGVAIDLETLSVDTFYVEPSQEFADAQWIFGFSNASETNTWRTALREAIEEGAGKYPNVELRITDANDSPAKQVSDLEDLLANGANGLIIGAATTDVANSILERTQQEGIPVIIVDRLVTSDLYTTFVTSDNHVMSTTDPGTTSAICSAVKERSRSSRGSREPVPRSSGMPAMTRCWPSYPDIEAVRGRLETGAVRAVSA